MIDPRLHSSYNIKANCPDCEGAFVQWDQHPNPPASNVLIQIELGTNKEKARWAMLKCTSCGRGGLAKYLISEKGPLALVEFHPATLREPARLPPGVPEDLVREYREAEHCVNNKAYRAASAMVRSTLEKALTKVGYTDGKLFHRIEAACSDGLITATRKARAHAEIRDLGNEVVHDEWREVEQPEVVSALHYAQRILEDLFDDKSTVDAVKAARVANKSQNPETPTK